MASPRTIAKLEARIHERAAYCIQFEVADPRAGMITLTGVKLSSDLSLARIRYTVLGGTSERSKAEHMLASAAGFIQRQVGRVLDMRRTPTLHFHYDESLEQSRRVDSLIAQALERDREIHEQGSSAELPLDAEEVEADEPGDEDFEADGESSSDETLGR